MQSKLTLARLREVLKYDSVTGAFTWRIKTSSRAMPGQIAGTLRKDGYLQIYIDRACYQAHRLAWFYEHGVWPNNSIDHINGVRNANAISNLRDVTATGNNQNRRTAINNKTTGLLGASYVKSRGKYQAQIKVKGRQIGLGHFDTPEEAHKVYVQAKRRLHPTCTI